MTWTTEDRWTCPHPTCGRIVVLEVVTTEKRARARMARVQRDHSRKHAATDRAAALRKLGTS